MTNKEEILQKLNELLDTKITVNGDLIINNYNSDKKKELKSDDKAQNVVKSQTPKKDENKPGSLAQQMRRDKSMTKWKREVHNRDEVCQCCGDTVDLECHHVMPLSQYPSIGTDPGNGILLCSSCHQDYHKAYEGSENAVTLAKFMKEFGQFSKIYI